MAVAIDQAQTMSSVDSQLTLECGRAEEQSYKTEDQDARASGDSSTAGPT